MSLLSTSATSPVIAARAAVSPQAQAQAAVLRQSEAPTSKAGAVGEMTAAASRIPPVQRSLGVTAMSTSRSGHEGRPDPAADKKAADDARQAEEDRRLTQQTLQETLARLPVSVKSIPKLSGDLETIRSIESPDNGLDRRA
ncbi:MAG: hypothetical protein AAF264_14485 [Pseudomonadota bacterium]